ncbi:hypothetical protein [Paenibacillus glacialis]|uniref:Uncharacterized protein n=1 Tax=Paenibacillus glacialis TaxID=494026 RepID=A0A162LY76_9BACL|nr:hypothetical protein [Paenibacillus glacialis]OAB41687.1 hypothetical protein PGLA_15545 [Paenibacillus glacialis]
MNALNQIPKFYSTKLSELPLVTSGSVEYEAAEKQKWISFEILLQMMWKLAECYIADDKTPRAALMAPGCDLR